ncbi:inositol polyphosphate phosphatase-like 1b isoform X2 [Eucyclogobius newberryi]|uniref:inositol polyphosphate phosphatase-like 1b isoform X2 n=1 Tax=Eucyclogobius newberryi TaxID=166745 RepID=UPI003B5A9546
MATAAWYHRDISRVHAEDLLARAGRDGSYLVRDSESVPGAYALCLLFQRHVHTYRILPDTDGLLAVQTTHGLQVNCFRTLEDLVLGYHYPHKGLVSQLLYPVFRDVESGDESSDDERPPPPAGQPVTTVSAPPPVTPGPSAIFLDKLLEMNTSSTASEMTSLLHDYLYKELSLDIENVHKGSTNLSHLRRTLGTACQGLNSEIDLTLSSLETLARVFDNPNCSFTHKAQGPDMEIDSLLCKVSTLVSLLSSLEKKVLQALQEAVSNHNLAVQPNPPPPPEPSTINVTCFAPVKNPVRHMSIHSFQVKMVRYGRQIVSVDVDSGVILFDRKADSFSVEKVSHDRILQIVKFQSSSAKVQMVVDKLHNTPREMIFESARKRNAFCQLLQLMKIRHSGMIEPDLISVFIGTWNMGGSSSPGSLRSWVTCCGLGHTPDESIGHLPHDIYAVGTQENQQSEREWTENLKATLRSYSHIDFKLVAVQSLWNMRLAVFVKPEFEGRISRVGTASVKTGLGNTLGNKGAVGVSFYLNETSFGFVNCHMTSGSDKVLRRNQNFMDVLRLLSLGDKIGPFDISLRFTHLFWCGDLNYRLDLDVQDILKHVSKREFEELMCADQLTRERLKRKCFLNFKEEKISFPPTYRYERGSRNCYLWQKYKTSGVRVNVPSWCDRILWKSYPETYITCTAYGCTDDIFSSDHSPVFATFQVGVTPHFVSRKDKRTSIEKAWIELEVVEVIVKTSSKATFFIEYYSPCLEETRRSCENDSQSCDVPGFLKLGWSFKQLPKLFPIFSDMEYLQDQHLLLSVKSCDGFESYGECCVALRSVIGASEQFETFLSHRGEEMGSIRGRVRVHIPKDRRGTRAKIYEFCLDKDDKPSVRGHLSPAQTRVPISSYTNPAYFIFEGVSVSPRQQSSPHCRDPPVIWSGNEVLQLPKVSGRPDFDRRLSRRADFTEIEIPALLPQYAQADDLHTPQTISSYQLFPAKNPLSISTPSCISKYQEQAVQHKVKCIQNTVQDSVLPEKNLKNLYMNHLVIIRDKDANQPERTSSIPSVKPPAAFPYVPAKATHSQASVPWLVEQQTPGLTGDNSLTALQIAKSLSEVDFFPIEQKSPSIQPKPKCRNGPKMTVDREYSWAKEVSVLQGAPETVKELLSKMGLQKYYQGLRLCGWDDLDYFCGITEADLRAAGVINPAHRRMILENLPKNWN